MARKANWAGDIGTFVGFFPQQGSHVNAIGAVGLKNSAFRPGGTARGFAMGVVHRELAKRLIVAEPGAGAKPG